MQQVQAFFEKHNLRPFLTVYLSLVHLYAAVGMVYAVLHPESLLKV